MGQTGPSLLLSPSTLAAPHLAMAFLMLYPLTGLSLEEPAQSVLSKSRKYYRPNLIIF